MKQTPPGNLVGRYLLDTHALLYMDQDPQQLPTAIRALIADTRNHLFVSLVSIWEIQIKCLAGKLALPLPVDRLLQRQQRDNAVDMLPIELAHVMEHAVLAKHHRDPFDRMLIAQARVEGLTIVSRDRVVSAYDVATRW